MSNALVDPKVVSLTSLLSELEAGKLRVPRFQRRFVWSGDRVVKLLRSVRRQYPIGSLLIWKSKPGYACFDRVGPHLVPVPADNPSEVGYLLDGHQRLSSLFGTLVRPAERLRGEDRAFAVYFDLDEDDFVRGDPKALWHVPLWVLMDNIQLLDRTQELQPQGEAASREGARATWEKRARTLKAVASVFQGYRVAVNEVQNADLDTAVNVFTLLNSTGVKMRPEEMFGALTWNVGDAERTGFDFAGTIEGIRLSFPNFAGLDATTVLRCLLARLDEDIYTNEFSELSRSKRRELPEASRSVATTIGQALAFVQVEWGVASVKSLPYALQIVLLSEFFRFNTAPSPAQRSELLRALWATSYTGAYAGSSPGELNGAVERVRQFARGELITLDSLRTGTLKPFPRNFHPKAARVRAVALMLKHLRPRDLVNGEELEWTTLLERGRYDLLTVSAEPRHANRLANRLLLGRARGDLKQQLLKLIEVAEVQRKPILASHALTEDALLHLDAGDVDRFVEEREREIQRRERAFARDYLVAAPPDGPPEVVEDAELDADDDADDEI